MSEVHILKTDFSNLKDCKVGERLELDGEVMAVNGDMLTVNVDAVEYGEPGVEPEMMSKENPVSKISAPRKRHYDS